MDPALWDKTLRLIAAAALGGAIGFERETHNRPAGLRTHILVCVGAALITNISIMTAGAQFDPGRITAQIVSGIGFLGAGTIVRQGNIIRGLTTAASLWTVAGIGIAVGSGGEGYYLAVVATLVVIVTLSILNRVESRWITRTGLREIRITFQPGSSHLHEIMTSLLDMALQIEKVKFLEKPEEGTGQTVSLQVKMPYATDHETITYALLAFPYVTHVEWQ
ncbi:MAG: MgtC/SapB family protein [Armatimonadetes bacterium]|nr:MgtC/SapB family protein [Armatimonadota bacterium]